MPKPDSKMRSRRVGTSSLIDSRAYADADLGTAATTAAGAGGQAIEEHPLGHACPDADERRVRALMLARMQRPGAWDRLTCGNTGVDPSTCPLAASADEGGEGL
jgi:hypothetical protein